MYNRFFCQPSNKETNEKEMWVMPKTDMWKNWYKISISYRTAAPKIWALPRFWVSIRSYKKQLVKKNWGRILGLAWIKFAVAAPLTWNVKVENYCNYSITYKPALVLLSMSSGSQWCLQTSKYTLPWPPKTEATFEWQASFLPKLCFVILFHLYRIFQFFVSKTRGCLRKQSVGWRA